MIYFLLVLYQIKHFVCDYPLQGKYMLGKFKPYPAFIMPLLAHSAVHGVATFAIAYFFKGPKIALLFAAYDMGIHFLVDRIKASPDMLGKFKALSANEMKEIITTLPTLPPTSYQRDHINVQLKSNVYFWWALGADQMAHHLTHYVIIWMLLR